MIPTKWQHHLLLLAAALGLLLTVAACEPADTQLIKDFAEEWARSKNISPTNADGSPNFSGLANILLREAGGSTGDSQADAAIDIATVIQKIMEADKLSYEGRLSGDLEKILKAIQMRPNDYTYRNSKGIALIVNGDVTSALSAFQEADQLAALQGTRAQRVNLLDRVVTFAAGWLANSPYPASVKQNMQTQYCRDAAAYARLSGDNSWVASRPECRAAN